jgi:cell division protein FtsQ
MELKEQIAVWRQEIIGRIRRFNLRSPLNILSVVALALTLVGLFSYQQSLPDTDEYIIHIADKHGNVFVNREEVVKVLNKVRHDHPNTTRLNKIALKTLEDSLRAVDFVKEAQVSRDLRGNLVIDIYQDQPIARLVGPSGKGGYISSDGDVLSLSRNYAARVLVITGSGADSLLNEQFLDSLEGRKVCDFINHISEDPFWKALIAQIDIGHDMDMNLYTQVGKQTFQFGKAENFEPKLKKMKLFFEEIAPKKGWNAYQVVKLQYDGQIVCQ